MKKILLVEDDLNMLELLEELIVDEGYAATSARDCRSAEKALKTENPDLILLDIGLPDGDSFGICRMASESNGGSGTPVFMLSGRSSLDYKMKSFSSGARKYFTKPFNMEELLKAMRSYLSPNGTARKATA